MALPKLRQVLCDWNAYLTECLTPEEAETMQELLRRVAQRAEDWASGQEAD